MLRKGQVTVFIIIGLLVIVGLALFLYYRSVILDTPEYVPDDLKPAHQYISSCLDQISQDAVVALGAHAGYITIPDHIETAQAYISIIPRSQLKIPLWYANGFDFTPTVQGMEGELSSYVQDHLSDCVDLTAFAQEYEVTADQLEATALIGDDDVSISVVYPLTFTDKTTGEQTTITKFQSTQQVRLKDLYTLGKQILAAENQHTYFENITLDLMGLNPSVPFNGLSFGCSPQKWSVRNVKQSVQDMVYYNLPNIRVKNTDYPDFLASDKTYTDLQKYTIEDISEGDSPLKEAPADAYDYSHYLLDVGTSKTDLSAGFMYQPTWNMQFTGSPESEGYLVSDVRQGDGEFLDFMCINSYHFTYDVVYPLQVILRDDAAFNGKGYVFRYGFTVHINHNEPDRQGFFNPDFLQTGKRIGACTQLAGNPYDIRILGTDEYGVANSELNAVNISYDCFSFSCTLGQTNPDEGAYRLRTQLPSSCVNGYLVAEKPGYLKARQQAQDSEDIDITLHKLKTLPFLVVGNTFDPATGSVGEDTTIQDPFLASITLRKNDNPRFSWQGTYPNEDNIPLELLEEQATYALEITVFDQADGVIIGGYASNWTVRYTDVAHATYMEFHVPLYLPKPLSKDQEQQVLEFIDQNKAYKEPLAPRFR